MAELQQLTELLLEHQKVVKVFHWQTKKYANHKSSDSYLETFAESMDKYVEVAQGIYGRLSISKISATSKIPVDDDIEIYISEFMDKLKSLSSKMVKNNKDLDNILADMLMNINQFKYLLTFG